jgi:hypothetical protein
MSDDTVNSRSFQKTVAAETASGGSTASPAGNPQGGLGRREFLLRAAVVSALYWPARGFAAAPPSPPTDLRIDGQPPITPPPPAPGLVSVAVVPERSRTVWDPGIPGGVPPDDASAATRQDGVGPAIQHGATIAAGASASTIQSALNAAGAVATKTSRRFVLLGPGTFTLNSELSIPSYVILRGTSTGIGNRQTILRQTFTGTLISIWGAGNQGSWGTVRNVVGVAYAGASQITVDSAANFNVGDILTIDQLTEGSYDGAPPLVYSPPDAGNWVWYLSSLWYQRQAYSTGNGTGFLFPDSDGWRHTSERIEVLAKSGNTLTIWSGTRGQGKPLHMTYYRNPQVYRCAGSNADVRRYAGVENLVIHPSGNNGQRVVIMNGAAYCWVKNVEIDGSAQSWSGRHCQLYSQTYRCEVRDSYFHESGNYTQGANAYGINVSGTNNLIENNIAIQLNKPIVMECSNGGNVIAYNYVDEAVISSLTNSWQEAAISSHASYIHHELFEGNWTPNIGVDSTHGNNGFNTAFRNFCRGRNSSNRTTAYRRAIFSDGWNMDFNSIGNVLWFPGSGVQNLFTASTNASEAGNTNGIGYSGVAESAVYLIGSNAWNTSNGQKPGADYMDDGTAYRHFHRHLDFDYFSNSQYRNPSNAVTALPNSLYLASKPAFFGSYEWPWIDPAASTFETKVKVLPAKARFDAGTP